ncbi:Fatty-acid amide hydrolase 2 [Elasticomyces elasticus]|uniref:Fatty-acid amide hydrolase 2 n=1 Tax=Exophiala sideris TaxID=1016849 RepID=A0ABR0JS87_9EURO|nr:Fatty-acid amide hydrolase 2 [Elasticomyces elasticus]KAK5040462.1 Fatty-acid amide hydrolase 2 [Exophiala sideris]KAK5043112.1 Fatty-acid amide hydrolase 2 [Exophiala sideris]KAK5068840.1 Fatty-acid amide hydrolase 2 [Exophiala sideris]KAK5186436.1 Fatty-acid amide hydrolase 2 [Eurotiomycetes sp. CCFEE 6388]
MTVQKWQEASRAKQAATSKLVETWLPPDFSVDDKLLNVMDVPAKYLSQTDNEITLLRATELVEKLRSGSLKSEDVVKAFCKRAAIAHKLVNCPTEPMFEAAVARSKELDIYYSENKKPFGPLHGLPISLKDTCNVKGVPTSLGYVGQVDRIAKRDSSVVEILKAAGAVIFTKTNLPTAIFHTRVPHQDVVTSMDGQETIHTVIGPMANSLQDLELAMQVIANAKPWLLDPKCAPIPWQNVEMPQKLCIGVMWDDGIVQPQPPIQRALKEVVEKLEKSGHEIIKWEPLLQKDIVNVWETLFVSDGGQDIKIELERSGEPVLPRIQRILDRAAPLSTFETWQLQQRKLIIQKEYLDRWNATVEQSSTGRPMDLILTAAKPTIATEHDKAPVYVGYAAFVNLMDYPSVVIPATQVDPEVDEPKLSTREAWNPDDEQNYAAYDPVVMKGMPVGLQFVGRRLHEENLLACAKIVEKALSA